MSCWLKSFHTCLETRFNPFFFLKQVIMDLQYLPHISKIINIFIPSNLLGQYHRRSNTKILQLYIHIWTRVPQNSVIQNSHSINIYQYLFKSKKQKYYPQRSVDSPTHKYYTGIECNYYSKLLSFISFKHKSKTRWNSGIKCFYQPKTLCQNHRVKC